MSNAATPRSPHGFTQRVARAHGSPLGWWTLDSGDTWEQMPAVDTIVERVRSAGGAVVLMHDFDRGDDDDPAARSQFVLNLTAALLNLAAEEQMRILPLDQILQEMNQPSAQSAGAPVAAQ